MSDLGARRKVFKFAKMIVVGLIFRLVQRYLNVL